jgi:hypothetical protein
VGRVTASQTAFIGRVDLPALHVRRDISRLHQAHLMAELYQLARPVMRCCRTPRCRPGKKAIWQNMEASATVEATCEP